MPIYFKHEEDPATNSLVGTTSNEAISNLIESGTMVSGKNGDLFQARSLVRRSVLLMNAARALISAKPVSGLFPCCRPSPELIWQEVFNLRLPQGPSECTSSQSRGSNSSPAQHRAIHVC
jgi:hypothetical protein